MRFIKLKKRGREEFREICALSKKEVKEYEADVIYLNALCLKLCDKCVHGFMPYCSPMTNALPHRGREFTLNFDLKDFFDTVRPEMVKEYVYESLLSKVFINGRAYQGMPTSPAIANLAAIKMDREILELVKELSKHELAQLMVYTRYADDLTFSFNCYDSYKALKERVPQIVEKFGFKINPKKTHLQTAKFGRRVITGVAVGKVDVRAPRKCKRDLRGMRHVAQQIENLFFVEKTLSLMKKNTLYERKIAGLSKWIAMRHPCYPESHVRNVFNRMLDILRARTAIENYGAFDRYRADFETARNKAAHSSVVPYEVQQIEKDFFIRRILKATCSREAIESVCSFKNFLSLSRWLWNKR